MTSKVNCCPTVLVSEHAELPSWMEEGRFYYTTRILLTSLVQRSMCQFIWPRYIYIFFNELDGNFLQDDKIVTFNLLLLSLERNEGLGSIREMCLG